LRCVLKSGPGNDGKGMWLLSFAVVLIVHNLSRFPSFARFGAKNASDVPEARQKPNPFKKFTHKNLISLKTTSSCIDNRFSFEIGS
ncbi:MAG: hypothetical protein ACQEUB_00650, partial [Thermodesulfobacteriota bacterium]